jgi:phosphoenolpyruvate-protein phosphotransferase
MFDEQLNPALAWHTAVTEIVDAYRLLEDPYLRQRAADVQDVGAQVIDALLGHDPQARIQIPTPSILFAAELTPAETAQLELDKVLGLITMAGGPTSHSAILARAMGIPAVTGADPFLGRYPVGTLAGLDGTKGSIWIEPPPEIVQRLQAARLAWQNERARLLLASHQPAATRDGQRRVEVAANVANLQDVEAANKNGAEAVGLLRTEFLFLDRETPPGEEEQVSTLASIGEVMGSRPVIVRTLDVGGDKALKYIDLPLESNPFLGVRAIRLSLRNPGLFLTQLRAILRAGARFNLRIMFPMVTDLDEYFQARELLSTAHQELETEGQVHRWPVETGIMVETPAVALLAAEFARQVDFFSIGTNDLTQYTLAAERGNASLAAFNDALHPAVLRLIQAVVRAAHEQGIWAGVCGELAGDPAAVPVLTGLGVDELSASPDRIPRVKAIVRAVSYSDAQDLASRLLAARDASSARRLAQAFLQEIAI